MTVGRRLLLGGGATLPLAACGDGGGWHDIDVSGTSPSLRFSLERAPDGATVTAADYRGKIVLLYFGYTSCPDVCPLTLQNVNVALARSGVARGDVRFLFVTVDPIRDTLPVLAGYLALFGPEFVGLRGSDAALARIARRYRIAYSVEPAAAGRPENVTHSSVIYVFDRAGRARLIVPSLASTTPDIPGVAADLRRLAREPVRPVSWLDRLA